MNIYRYRTLHGMRWLLAVLVLATGSLAADDAVREWTDSTGRFKVTGKLLEVQDGNVLLENSQGKKLRIPIDRLSEADQAFLKGEQNPFEMVDGADSSGNAPGRASTGSAVASTEWWSGPQAVNWEDAEQFTTLAGVQWQLPESKGRLDFTPKRAALTKKANFHEHLHRVAINTVCRRAVVASSVSFAVPKPQTRLSLVDLVTGKSVHSEAVTAHMRPLALLDDGSSILMVGCSDQRGGYEQKNELQLWRFDGKQIVRSDSWVPYENDKDRRGQVAAVVAAEVLDRHRVLTLSNKGHVVLWNLPRRKPLWHGRLSERNFAMTLSADRELLALFDEKTLMVVRPDSAEVLGSTALPSSEATGWCRLAWSPSGKRLLLTSINDIRVMDVETGNWEVDFSFPGGPVAPNAMSYPDENFVLLENRLLVDLRSKIKVCEYRDANHIQTIGGTCFVAKFGDGGGLLSPFTLPHPEAVKMLEKAEEDPSLFLLHPGVAVSIDVSQVPQQHQQTVREGLEKSAAASGYEVNGSSPIRLSATITGPEQEAVSYIAAGSYVVNQYTSKAELQWQDHTLWTSTRTNIPGLLRTKRGQTMQEALDEAGKAPNTSMFASLQFPKFMQKPSDNQSGGGTAAALMASQFTLQGLVDVQ
ncbi:SHD1 domain-containing protein [Roseimaritima ulvae]|uniref:SLA1 homology domain-containing protein n=1 Tax=Roseimaritima ulvae TaxID=980254 RepID=A0A5B9QV54_9BACT|nr:SHD1 domain-containing protein [Roseimaritima ulvae]QEG41680.1 hypothetical protein UC8_37060 [Roseimaritima ulvae]